MRIINTFDNIAGCFLNGNFSINAWRKYTKSISLELSNKCENDSKDYDFNTDIVPVLNNVIQNKEKSILANDSFIAVSKELENNISKLFEDNIELDIILYLGLCNGAGWATSLNNRNVILLGIEKIIELNWQDKESMRALIFHEIGHFWHKLYGNPYQSTSSQADISLLQLYQEGIAMTCENILCQKENFYHQDTNGWLDWCMKNQSDIKLEYLRRIKSNESTQDFFGDWCSYKGHSDVGYFLGYEFIKYLQNQYTLIEIANLNINELNKYYEMFVLQG